MPKLIAVAQAGVLLLLLAALAACNPTTGDDVTVLGADELRTPIPQQTPTLTPTPFPREAFEPITSDSLENLEIVRDAQAHVGSVFAVQFSEAGSLLYSFGADGVLRRWRMADGALTAEYGLFQSEGISAAFLRDDLAVVAGDVSQVVVINLQNGTELLRQIAPEQVSSLAFVPNTDPAAPQIAVGYVSGRTQVISVNDGAVLLDVSFARGNSSVLGLAFDATADTLITGHRGSNILLWNAKNGERLDRLTTHRGDVLSVQRLPDGSGFVTTSADNSIRIFSFASAEQTQIFRGHRFNVAQVAFNADASLMASTGQDATVRLWEPATARELFVLDTRPGSGGIIWTRGVAFSPDNQWLVVGNDAGELQFLAVLTEAVRAERAANASTPTPAPES